LRISSPSRCARTRCACDEFLVGQVGVDLESVAQLPVHLDDELEGLKRLRTLLYRKREKSPEELADEAASRARG
jgi:hypothetical protein